MNQNGDPKKNVEKKIWRLVDIFMPGDVAKVKEYVFKEVIGPTLRKLLYDIIVGSSYRMIFPTGQSAPTTPGITGVDYSKTQRTSLNGSITATEIQIRQNSWYTNTPIIDTQARAMEILGQLLNIIQTYGVARVADFYDLLGATPAPDHTANNYGWDDLSKADIVPSGNGYQIRFPRPKPLPR